MASVSLYDLTTGDIVGSFVVPDFLVAANTPDGFGVVDGAHDGHRYRVVLADDGFGNARPVVVHRKPARPADTEDVEWAFDEVADEWVAHPTLGARRSALRSARNAELQATDGVAIAALEAVLRDVLGALSFPLPSGVQRLLDCRDQLRRLPEHPDFDRFSVADVPRYAASGSAAD